MPGALSGARCTRGRAAATQRSSGRGRSIALFAPVEWCPPDEYRHCFDVNFFGAVACTRALLVSLQRAAGRVVNVTGIAGRVAAPNLSAYCCSKSAMEMFSDCLRLEQHVFGVSVHVIEPGCFRTHIFDEAVHRERAARLWQALPSDGAPARAGARCAPCLMRPPAQSPTSTARRSWIAKCCPPARAGSRPSPRRIFRP